MPRAFNILSSRNKFAKRHYEAIATVIQNLVLSDDELSGDELCELQRRRECIAYEFADMFASDNGQFQRDLFICACVPGANVRARNGGQR
jgi:hypothetical protein